MISGIWVNTYTGEQIKVVNTIIDGDQMLIITDSGHQLSMEEFSNNYIQADNFDDVNIPLKSEKPIIEQQKNINSDILDKPFKSNKKSNNTINKDNEDPIKDILDKFFNKIENKEDLLEITINTDIIPIDKLKIIIEYMDISIEDVSKYITEYIINKEYLSNIVKKYLDTVL